MSHHFSKTRQNAITFHSPLDADNFVPSPDEIARKAYFAYENLGSRPGHDVQHWLKAEADLIAERELTREHGYHNKT